MPGNPEFEKSFADLAFSYVSTNAPKLFNHMVGFQILDKNEDETRAVGVFGFQLANDSWYYAPVFFINGDLKGQELLFDKAANLMLPMEEGWIDNILSKRPTPPGEAAGETISEIGQYSPVFSRLLKNSPIKRASHQVPCEAQTPYLYLRGSDFSVDPLLAQTLKNTVESPRYKSAAAALDMTDLFENNSEFRERVQHSVKTSKAFQDGVKKFYPEWFSTAFQKQARTAIDDYDDVPHLYPQYVAEEDPGPEDEISRKDYVVGAGKDKANTKVAFLTEMAQLASPGVTSEMRKTFIKQGYVINDARSSEETSTLVDLAMPESISNPATSGSYLTLMSDGTLNRCALLRNCQEPSGDGNGAPKSTSWYVIELDTGRMLRDTEYGVPGSDILVVTTSFEPLPESLSIKAENLGSDSAVDDDPWRTKVIVLSDAGDAIHKSTPLNGCYDNIMVSPRASRAYRMNSEIFVVTKDTDLVIAATSNDKSRKTLGTWTTLKEESQGTPLQVRNNGGSNYVVEGEGGIKRAHNPLAVLQHLVYDHGLTPEAAHTAVKSATEKQDRIWAVKYAKPYVADDINPYIPMLPESASIVDSYNGIPVQENETFEEEAQGMPQLQEADYGEFDRDTNNGFARATKTDQKDMFDVSALSSLLKTTDVDNTIDKYMKDMTLAVDRYGRILFLMYYHLEEFKERYGTDELDELEDTLRDTFKTSGRLLLFLKKQSLTNTYSTEGRSLEA